jgi:hypothetical protein
MQVTRERETTGRCRRAERVAGLPLPEVLS